MEFGDFIKKVRQNKKLSLREAARRSGISHPYLSQLETGKNKKPTPDIIKKISKGLDVPYADLMSAAGYADDDGKVHLESFFDMVPPSMERGAKNGGGVVYYGANGWGYANDENGENKIDLHNFLSDPANDFNYKKANITDENIKNIKTFIESFIINKEGD